MSGGLGPSDQWVRSGRSHWFARCPLGSLKWLDEQDRFLLYVTASAAYGGPIALVRDENVFQPAKGSLQPRLQIFTALGSEVGSAPWPYRGLIALGWGEKEVCVAVFQDAIVRTFSPLCKELHFFSLGEKLKSEGGVTKAAVWTRGVVVITGALNIYLNASLEGPKIIRLVNTALNSPLLALAVVQPTLDNRREESRNGLDIAPADSMPRVFISLETGPVFVADSTSCIDINLTDGPYSMIAVSRSGRKIALFSSTGTIKIYLTTDLSKPVAVTSLECRRKPLQMEWLADEAIAFYVALPKPSGGFQHVVFVRGLTDDDWLPFQFDRAVYLLSEVDGLTVVSSHKREMFQLVPKCIESIYSVGSIDPPALLCYAFERYEQGDAVSEESLRHIGRHMEEATNICLEAAIYEWDVDRILTLLRACVFGRQFMSPPRSSQSDLIRTCRDIRICLALQKSPWEIPITVLQLRHLGISTLVRNLAARRYHLLALRICSYVGASPTPVVVDWSLQKITESAGKPEIQDDSLGRILVEKLNNCPNVSFSKVAYCAAKVGRPHLATYLLKQESRPEAQVDLLLRLAQVNVAMSTALRAKSPDLVHRCLETIFSQEQKTADGEEDLTVLVHVLKDNPGAEDFLVAFYRQTGNWAKLQRYFERSARHHKVGWCAIEWAATRTKIDWDFVKRRLASAAGFFGSHANRGGVDATVQFAHQATLEQVELLSAQKDLDITATARGWSRSSGFCFQGLSLKETLVELMCRGETQEAVKLKKQFGVSDRLWIAAQSESFVSTGRFEDLRALISSKTSLPGGLNYALTLCSQHQTSDSKAKTTAARMLTSSQESDSDVPRAYWCGVFGLEEASIRRTEDFRTPQDPQSTSTPGGYVPQAPRILSTLAAEATNSAGGLLQSISGVFRRSGE